MEYRKFNQRYVVRLNRNEEVIKQLTQLAQNEKIQLASVTGLGATNEVTVGLYRVKDQKYISKTLRGDMEITSLVGSITTKEDAPYLHLHINVADENQNVQGGHLNKCIISATCEIFVDVINGCVNRKFDEEIGLNLFEFE